MGLFSLLCFACGKWGYPGGDTSLPGTGEAGSTVGVGGGPSWLPSFSLFLPQGRQRHPIFPAPHPGDPAQGWSPCAHAAQPRARWRWSPSLRELPGSQLRQVVASLGHRCPGEASWRRSPELSLRGVKVSISQRGFIRDPIWKDPCEPKRLGNI